MSNAEFVYRFTVCPDEQWGFGPSLFQVFEAANTRVEMRMTEDDFERLRLNLAHDGFALRDVEREAEEEGHAAA